MALTNAERQRKHREKVSKTLSKISTSPIYTYSDLVESYLDKLTLSDYEEILSLGLLHFDPDFVRSFERYEKEFVLSAVYMVCRHRLNKEV